MLVIGIDPGIGKTGYGLVNENEKGIQAVAFGVILTEINGKSDIRLVSLNEQLNTIINLHKPEAAAVEKLFFQRNISTAISVGQARGVALLALAKHHVPVAEYGPKEIKQAVTGYGGADKRQMQHMVATLLGLNSIPRPDDAADALAVAICHLHNLRNIILQQA